MGHEHVRGALYAVLAYGAWGLVPLYWRVVRHVPGLEMVAHRVVWSVPVLWALVLLRGQRGAVGEALRDPRHRRLLGVTALLVAANWLTFIWAIQTDRVLEASLGYFVNPLVNVLLGTLVLGERLRRLQAVAVLVAAIGVLWLAIAMGTLPWISLALAITFGLYGLLRKQAGVGALPGLAAETVLLAPAALTGFAVLAGRGEAVFLHGTFEDALWIAASGVVTALPLLWFANAARRLRYVTLGFFQYLAPTGQFLLSVLAFGEPFTPAHAVAFPLIWIALVLYGVDSARGARARPAAVDAGRA
jgi:chloramphenicol-sensitive protein RarD